MSGLGVMPKAYTFSDCRIEVYEREGVVVIETWRATVTVEGFTKVIVKYERPERVEVIERAR